MRPVPRRTRARWPGGPLPAFLGAVVHAACTAVPTTTAGARSIASGARTTSVPAAPPPTETPAAHSASTAASEEPAARELTFRPTPEGLEIDVEGSTLRLVAEAVRVGPGWGVHLKLTAEPPAEGWSLSTPARGPLAVAAERERDGATARESDSREGEGAESLLAPRDYTRRWPGEIARALGAGERAVLAVGLWGLGRDEAGRRPVRGIARVTVMVPRQGRPTVLLEPPPFAR